jgi:signal transduction histidine kinase
LFVDKMFVPFEFRIQRPSGEIRNLYIISLEKDSKENIFGVIKDITERKEAERERFEATLLLERTEKQLIEAQKLANIGSWLFNTKNQKSKWSEEMFHIWDFDLKNGPPDFGVVVKKIHLDDLKLYHNSIENASIMAVPYDIEFRINLQNDVQKIVRSICKPVLGDTGKVVGLSGTNQDITSQKLFEEAQIKHQRLKAIGEMSASIAHDFNNSLQQMMGNLEIVKIQNELPENTLDRLNSIGTIIADISDRVSVLQKFGDTAHDHKTNKRINFNTLIKESLKESRPLWKDGMEKEGLSLTVTTEFKEVPEINCNTGELKSVLYNLIKNSVEAMPKGGKLLIKTGIKPTGVFATFTDTGIGMDKETRLKIFQPFFSTKGFQLGRGLGMSGAYSIIKKYRGDIVVASSNLNKGTTIEIIFPISQ